MDSNHINEKLIEVARVSPVKEVIDCLNHGANVNYVDFQGRTALGLAAFRGNIELAQVLRGRGATVDGAGGIGHTPLMWALFAENLEMVKYLVKWGANVNAVNSHGDTPMHYGVRTKKIEFVKALFTPDKNIKSVQNKQQHSPLSLAASESTDKDKKIFFLLLSKIDNTDLISLRSSTLYGQDIENELFKRQQNGQLDYRFPNYSARLVFSEKAKGLLTVSQDHIKPKYTEVNQEFGTNNNLFSNNFNTFNRHKRNGY